MYDAVQRCTAAVATQLCRCITVQLLRRFAIPCRSVRFVRSCVRNMSADCRKCAEWHFASEQAHVRNGRMRSSTERRRRSSYAEYREQHRPRLKPDDLRCDDED